MIDTNHDTLSDVSRLEQDVRKSRFLAIAAPVITVDEAMAFLAEHHVADATHNCWAYRIGNQYRFNDDGEPSGTAGKPILQAIEGQGLDAVVVLVVRWFGGIKLGAGGLVRAYGGAAAECLRIAPRRHVVARTRVSLACAYSEQGAIRQRLAASDATDIDQTFEGE
ncbi:MAG: YigZ family protein, partial [Comamonadaceae bacterium]